MAWIIQSACDGPVLINDLGLMLHKGQMKDLDLLGRENAERSNDLKILMRMTPPRIRDIKKDPYTPPGTVDPQVIKDLTETANKARATVDAQAATIQELKDEVVMAKEQNKAILSKMEAILGAVSKFAEEHPREIRVIKEAIENIKIERGQIAHEMEKMAESGVSDEEITAHDKILKMKDKKLERNLKNLGNTISASDNVDEVIDAMDELGI